MAIRQPIKSTAAAVRSKPVAKPHVGDGLEAILQNNPQLRRLFMQAKERGAVTFDQLNAALPQDFPPEQTEEVIQLLDAQGIAVRNDDAGGETEAEAADAEPAAEGEPAAAEAAEGEEEVVATEEELGPHRRSGPHVPARDGHDRAALARGRDRDRQADRGRPQHGARGAVREPADDAGGDRLARRDPRGPRAAARHHRPRGHQRYRARPRSDRGHCRGRRRSRRRAVAPLPRRRRRRMA